MKKTLTKRGRCSRRVPEGTLTQGRRDDGRPRPTASSVRDNEGDQAQKTRHGARKNAVDSLETGAGAEERPTLAAPFTEVEDCVQ